MGSNDSKGTYRSTVCIRFFSYVKDEILFIEKWLHHHASISKWYLLHVVDNHSTDGTWELLQSYKKKYGINIYRHDNYQDKGGYISSLIRKYNSQHSLAVPLDGDEFLVLYDHDQVDNNPLTIKNYMINLPKESKYRTHGTLFSVPTVKSTDDPFETISRWKWGWVGEHDSKKFYTTIGFKSTDHGNHHGIADNKNYTPTKLVLVHYHDIGFDHYKAKCEKDIASLNIDLRDVHHDSTFTGQQKARALSNIDNWDYNQNTSYDTTYKWK